MDRIIWLIIFFGWFCLMLKPRTRSLGVPRYPNPPPPPKRNEKRKRIHGIPHAGTFK